MVDGTAGHRLSLDKVTGYRIQVAGLLDDEWSEWVQVTITAEDDATEGVVSTLQGTFDQASLHGVLTRLYTRGFPILSVICLEHHGG